MDDRNIDYLDKSDIEVKGDILEIFIGFDDFSRNYVQIKIQEVIDIVKSYIWISVKDRLPNIGEYFVIVKHRPSLYLKPSVEKAIYVEPEWTIYGKTIDNVNEFVTHWMELPELPRDYAASQPE